MSESPERGSPTPHVGVLAGMRFALGATLTAVLVSGVLKLATDSPLPMWIMFPDRAAEGCREYWLRERQTDPSVKNTVEQWNELRRARDANFQPRNR
ncbi:MAG: hypothetical protein IT458_20100 [Planctomycetes bacterium]|nr:hypothetical protein [Planctomycetota bacterium]